MLVRYDCGCIGLTNVLGTTPNDVILISPCDRSSPNLGFNAGSVQRDWTNKPFEPLSTQQAADLVAELDALTRDGHKFRELRALLAPGHEP